MLNAFNLISRALLEVPTDGRCDSFCHIFKTQKPHLHGLRRLDAQKINISCHISITLRLVRGKENRMERKYVKERKYEGKEGSSFTDLAVYSHFLFSVYILFC